jgi:hypothetical protein
MTLKELTHLKKKLRIITGLEDATTKPPLISPKLNDEMMDDYGGENVRTPNNDQTYLEPKNKLDFKDIYNEPAFLELKGLYDKKIAANLGFNKRYKITQQWSEIIKNSFELSYEYASFDYKFRKVKEAANDLEANIHKLDQYLLDKTSILKSTPSILPSVGWITSYLVFVYLLTQEEEKCMKD